MRRVFLLSPADSSGVRAKLLLREQARSELAGRVRESGAPLGEIFSFMSSLYFRGKLAYARPFAGESEIQTPIIQIITASRGLVAPEISIGRDALNEMAKVAIDASNPMYR